MGILRPVFDNINAGCNTRAMNRRLGLKSVFTIPFCLTYIIVMCIVIVVVCYDVMFELIGEEYP